MKKLLIVIMILALAPIYGITLKAEESNECARSSASSPTVPVWASDVDFGEGTATAQKAICQTETCGNNVSCPAGTQNCQTVERNCLLGERGHVICDGQRSSCEPCPPPTCSLNGSNCISEAWCQAKCLWICNSKQGACGGGKCYCGLI